MDFCVYLEISDNDTSDDDDRNMDIEKDKKVPYAHIPSNTPTTSMAEAKPLEHFRPPFKNGIPHVPSTNRERFLDFRKFLRSLCTVQTQRQRRLSQRSFGNARYN